jgi:nanoRNase/pAp phosphatase (c-di-AMP/oligoRNAs hydrolase)
LGGGGHNRAAGCTFDGSVEDAKATILKAVEQAVPRIITG